MVQSRKPHYPSGDFDHFDGPSPAQATRRPASGRQGTVTTRAIHQVVVLEVFGRLADVVEDLDLAIQRTLAEEPRGVACDLSGVHVGTEPGAVEVLAKTGRHVRDWPGAPVALACPNPRVREALSVHVLGGHLIVTESSPAAVSAVLATPIPLMERLRLAPHPTATRASRDFVTRTLMGWGLGELTHPACQVISELVTNSTVHAGTDIVVSVAWSQGALRLSVRDKSADLPRQENAHLGAHGQGLIIVASFSRVFGALPTAEGGKVVWAVLDATPATPPGVDGVPHVNQSELPTTVTRCGTDTEESSHVSPLNLQIAQKEHPDLCLDRGTP